MKVAKVFQNGQSQAIRLPKKFRVETKEVSIRQVGPTLVILPLIKSWQEVFSVIASISSDEVLPARKDLILPDRSDFE